VDLSILIPIYNSSSLIEGSVESLQKILRSENLKYEILLRDDASRDNSRDILTRIQNSGPARCFFSEKNQGLGFTLRQLMKEAKGKFCVYLDCDLPFGAEVVPKLMKELEDADIVVASRYLNGPAKVKLSRHIASRLYYFLCLRLFRITVKDIGSGSVAFRRDAVEKLNLRANGFDFHIEFFAKAVQEELRVKEFFFPHQNKISNSSFSLIKHGPCIVFQTLNLWLRHEKLLSEGRQW